MNRKMRVGWWFLVMGILCLGLTLGMTCKKHNQSTASFTATFGGSADDWGGSVQQTSDGGYIVAGFTESRGTGGRYAWLVRTDAAGNEIWDRTFGGVGMEQGDCIRQTSDGGYVVVGWSQSHSGGGIDAWLFKTNASGSKVWERTFGGAGSNAGYSVWQASDGGYVIAGSTESCGAGAYDVWLIKTDSSGNKVWDKIFGGPSYDAGYSVQQTSDGGHIIAGSTESYGSGDYDVWLIKTDSLGNESWNKAFGGTGDDEGYSVQQTTDGGYIITGYTCSFGSGGRDVWLVKTDASGSKVWDKTFGGTLDDWGKSVQQTSDGGYVVAGSTESDGAGEDDVWLVKTDVDGNRVWDRTFGGSAADDGYSVQQTSDGGCVVTGCTESYGAGKRDVWLIKTDADGN